MVSLRNLLSKQNIFKNRNAAINLRNVGAKTYIFGLHLYELLGGLIFCVLGVFVWSKVVILFFSLVWIFLSYSRKNLTGGSIKRRLYRSCLPGRYAYYSEDWQFFGDYLKKSSGKHE